MNLNFPAVSIPAILVVTMSSFTILLARDWRWIVSALALQYIGVFILTAFSWPLEMAVVKLIAGWIACTILGLGMGNASLAWPESERYRVSNQILRILAAIMIGLVIISSVPSLQSWLPGVALEAILGGVILLGMGLLHLGLTTQPFRVISGLLTILAGFEILYAGLEVSALVAGLQAFINLALALVGVYLSIFPSTEASE